MHSFDDNCSCDDNGMTAEDSGSLSRDSRPQGGLLRELLPLLSACAADAFLPAEMLAVPLQQTPMYGNVLLGLIVKRLPGFRSALEKDRPCVVEDPRLERSAGRNGRHVLLMDMGDLLIGIQPVDVDPPLAECALRSLRDLASEALDRAVSRRHVVKSILVHVTPPGRAAVQVAIPNDGLLSHSSFCTVAWDELLDAWDVCHHTDVAVSFYLRELRRMVDSIWQERFDFERRFAELGGALPLTHELYAQFVMWIARAFRTKWTTAGAAIERDYDDDQRLVWVAYPFLTGPAQRGWVGFIDPALVDVQPALYRPGAMGGEEAGSTQDRRPVLVIVTTVQMEGLDERVFEQLDWGKNDFGPCAMTWRVRLRESGWSRVWEWRQALEPLRRAVAKVVVARGAGRVM